MHGLPFNYCKIDGSWKLLKFCKDGLSLPRIFLVKSCIFISIICLQFCIAQKHGYLHVTFQTKNQHHSTNDNITLRKQTEKVGNQTMQGV
jgi:hypothetical protein